MPSNNLIQKLLNQRSQTLFGGGIGGEPYQIEPFSALYNNLKPLQININQPNQLYPLFPLNRRWRFTRNIIHHTIYLLYFRNNTSRNII